QGAQEQCAPAKLDGTIEFAFLQQRMTEPVKSEKIIGTYRYCLLIMSDCVVSPALLKEKIAQGHLSIGIGWSHGYSILTMHNRFVHLAFRRKSGAEIVLGIPPVRLHLQGRPVMSDGIV